MATKYRIHADKKAKAALEKARSKGLLLTNALMQPLIREEERVITQQELDEMDLEFHTRLANVKKAWAGVVRVVEEGVL